MSGLIIGSLFDFGVTVMTVQGSMRVASEYMSRKQLAHRYQVNPSTIWRWSRLTGFPVPLSYRSTVSWRVESVEAFLLSSECSE